MSEVGFIKVTIPEGITRIALMILDDNLNRKSGNEDGDVVEEFPLYQYPHIDTHVIPSSVKISHDERYSSFASYEQRGFVWNYPTGRLVVKLSTITANFTMLNLNPMLR